MLAKNTLPADVTNEYIEGLLYKKPGVSAYQLLYRDFNKEAVYKALARKGETLKHLWQKYNGHRYRRRKEANELSPVLQALQRMG